MQTVAFRPLDTVFFRNGKPFDMGEDNWAEGQVMPFPSVFYGAIRSAYFAAHPDKINDIGKKTDPTADLQITGIFLANSRGIFIPAPLDLVREKSDSDGRFSTVSLREKEGTSCYSSYPYALIPYEERDVVNQAESFISLNVLHRKIPVNVYDSEHFVKSEPKIGVGLNNSTRAGEKGKLFRVGLMRFNHSYNLEEKETNESYFVVSYQGLESFQGNLIKLGAEGKVARMESTLPVNFPQLPKEAKQSKFFKMILLTPGIFRNGDSPQLERLLNGIEVKSVVPFVGKPKAIGGWDMQNNRPKEMSRAVPAGSVYYYEIESDHTLEDVEKALSDTVSISEDSLEQCKAGFGLYILAHWNPNKQ